MLKIHQIAALKNPCCFGFLRVRGAVRVMDTGGGLLLLFLMNRGEGVKDSKRADVEPEGTGYLLRASFYSWTPVGNLLSLWSRAVGLHL
jgi:hypothetical protein